MSCQNKNKSGSMCKKSPLRGKDYCYFHRPRENHPVYNENCPICFEKLEYTVDVNDNIVLQCNHSFHYNCISNINSMKCPLCRTKIHSLPDELYSKIQSNEKHYEEEISMENLNRAIEEINQIDENIRIDLTFSNFLPSSEDFLRIISVVDRILHPSL